MASDAVPNEIRNDCYMATELIPNKIEYDHWTYWIAYRMASQETVEITTKRWPPRSHSDGYPCKRTSHGDREHFQEPYRTKPVTKTLTEWHTERSRNYRWTAYRSECQSSLPEAYQMTAEKQIDILPKLPTEMATEKSSNNAPKRSSKWLSPRSGPLRPYWMPNHEMARSANAIFKEAFPEQNHFWYIVSMTYRDINMLDMNRLCHPWVVTRSAICESLSQCLERKLIELSEVKTGSKWWSIITPTFTLANSDDGLCLESTLQTKCQTEFHVE